MNKSVGLFLLVFICNVKLSANIIIRPARINDLASLIDLDRRVTFEYFLPLVQSHLTHIPFWQDAQKIFEDDVVADYDLFRQTIATQTNSRLLVAWDDQKSLAAGFLLFTKEDAKIRLDLLIIDENYRRHGIGKKLTHEAFGIFSGIKECELVVLQCNTSAIQFYERLGFKIIEETYYSIYPQDGMVYYRMVLKLNSDN